MIENLRIKRILTGKRLLLAGICVLVVFALIRNAAPTPAAPVVTTQNPETTSQAETEELGIHGIGESKTGVVLIEYGDFSSAASKAYQPMIQEVMSKYGDQLQFIYRDFPNQGNLNSMAAQRSANAAEAQGLFWRMRELLYDRQDAWKDNAQAGSTFQSYAKELGMDMEQYERDIKNDAISTAITTDIQAGQKQQVTAAPIATMPPSMATGCCKRWMASKTIKPATANMTLLFSKAAKMVARP